MRQLTKRAVAATALVCTALLVNGCTAEGHGTPPAPEQPQATGAPPAPLAPTPQAPPAQPAAPLGGLGDRINQATADAADTGADLQTAVLDRDSGQIYGARADVSFPIASVVKLFIADDLLLQEAEGRTTLSPADRRSLDSMLRSSDDGAAESFWERSGGSAVISRIVARYGLTGTRAPYDGGWDVTTSTANDLVRYYDMLLDGTGGLPRDKADIIVNDLAQSTPTGLDGYPQRFGIPEGLFAEPVAVKQGWFCCWNGGNQLHVSTGAIGPDRRFVMAVSSLDPTSDASARAHLTEAVKTMFPGGSV